MRSNIERLRRTGQLSKTLKEISVDFDKPLDQSTPQQRQADYFERHHSYEAQRHPRVQVRFRRMHRISSAVDNKKPGRNDPLTWP